MKAHSKVSSGFFWGHKTLVLISWHFLTSTENSLGMTPFLDCSNRRTHSCTVQMNCERSMWIIYSQSHAAHLCPQILGCCQWLPSEADSVERKRGRLSKHHGTGPEFPQTGVEDPDQQWWDVFISGVLGVLRMAFHIPGGLPTHTSEEQHEKFPYGPQSRAIAQNM